MVMLGAVGLAICKPDCRVSVNDCPVLAILPAAVLLMVKVSVVVLFSATLATPNALVKIGRGCTVKLAVLDAIPVDTCAEDTPDVALGCTPTTVLATVKVTVQLAFAGIVKPVIEMAV